MDDYLNGWNDEDDEDEEFSTPVDDVNLRMFFYEARLRVVWMGALACVLVLARCTVAAVAWVRLPWCWQNRSRESARFARVCEGLFLKDVCPRHLQTACAHDTSHVFTHSFYT